MFNNQLYLYYKLTRLNKPAAILLLLLPTLWSLVCANQSIPKLNILFVFIFGAFLMRSAGCIINDIIDKKYDKLVERTKDRPLTNQDISIRQAIIILLFLLLLAALLLFQFNKITIIIGIFSVIPIIIYPFMKRMTYFPQIFLGFTFNIGVILAWTITKGKIESPALLLYLASIFWTIAYDTIYAHQDKSDDQKIGLKSTAIKLGRYTKLWLYIFYACVILNILLVGNFINLSKYFYITILAAFLYKCFNIIKINLNDQESCYNAFKNDIIFGCLILIAFVVGVY